MFSEFELQPTFKLSGSYINRIIPAHTPTHRHELLTEETTNITIQYIVLFTVLGHIGGDKIFEIYLVP